MPTRHDPLTTPEPIGEMDLNDAWKTRGILWVGLFATLLAGGGAGCPQMIEQYRVPSVRALPETASLEDVVAVVNYNSDKVQSLYSTNVRVTGTGYPALRAQFALEKPRRFRLVGKVIKNELDVGSNDEHFWFWTARGQPPAVFFCRHDQFHESAAKSVFPFEPDWLIDAVAPPRLEMADQLQGPYQVGQGRLEIRSQRVTRQGIVHRITMVDAVAGTVLEQHLYNDQGALIASAVSSDHRIDPATGISLPRRIALSAPPNLSLELHFDTLEVNRTGGDPNQLWRMPDYPGFAVVDLADPRVRLQVPPLAPTGDPSTTSRGRQSVVARPLWDRFRLWR